MCVYVYIYIYIHTYVYVALSQVAWPHVARVALKDPRDYGDHVPQQLVDVCPATDACSPVLRMCGLGFGVWGFWGFWGLGFWGSGFGVWGLGQV